MKLFCKRSILLADKLKHKELLVARGKNQSELAQMLEEANSSPKVKIMGKSGMQARPSVEEFAKMLAALPEEQIRDSTWLMRGSEVHGKYLGTKLVFDFQKP